MGMIKREDARKMKTVAEEIANAKSELEAQTIEDDFVYTMTGKYGKKIAGEMLLKVLNMSRFIKLLPEGVTLVDG